MSNNIFVFWTDNNEMTQNRLSSIQQLKSTSECEVILIDKNNLSNYLVDEHPLHPSYQYLSAVHRADYLRTYFMHFYGGGYSDIKKTRGSWKKAFEKLYNSDTWIIGYKEIYGGNAPTVDVKLCNILIGNGSYICKKNTLLTTEWYSKMLKVLDTKLHELKMYPAKHPRDAQSKNSKYPIGWTEILGNIFHPLIIKYNNKVLFGVPMCICNNYQ